MNCEHARLLIGSEPCSTSPELAEHLESCPACRQYQIEMVALEANIRRALEHAPLSPVSTAAAAGSATSAEIAAPALADSAPSAENRSVRPIGTRRSAGPAGPAAWRGLALAASVLIAVVTTLVVWTLRPSDTLGHDLAQHVIAEPQSWESRQPVDAHSLEDILGKAGVGSGLASSDVVYARTCLFRGHFVPHLVVQTTTGPVTVLVLPDEHVQSRESFSDSGLAGVIVPAAHGSIAVLARGAADLDSAAGAMRLRLR